MKIFVKLNFNLFSVLCYNGYLVKISKWSRLVHRLMYFCIKFQKNLCFITLCNNVTFLKFTKSGEWAIMYVWYLKGIIFASIRYDFRIVFWNCSCVILCFSLLKYLLTSYQVLMLFFVTYPPRKPPTWGNNDAPTGTM